MKGSVQWRRVRWRKEVPIDGISKLDDDCNISEAIEEVAPANVVTFQIQVPLLNFFSDLH